MPYTDRQVLQVAKHFTGRQIGTDGQVIAVLRREKMQVVLSMIFGARTPRRLRTYFQRSAFDQFRVALLAIGEDAFRASVLEPMLSNLGVVVEDWRGLLANLHDSIGVAEGDSATNQLVCISDVTKKCCNHKKSKLHESVLRDGSMRPFDSASVLRCSKTRSNRSSFGLPQGIILHPSQEHRLPFGDVWLPYQQASLAWRCKKTFTEVQ